MDGRQRTVWSFALVVGIGFLLLVSLAVSAWLAALGEFFAHRLPAPAGILETANILLSFSVITFLFAMAFKLLPDVQVAWRDVWLGAALTSLLFTVGKTIIALYLGRGSVSSAYGAAGSLVVVLLWGPLLLADTLLRRRVYEGLDAIAGQRLRARRDCTAGHG